MQKFQYEKEMRDYDQSDFRIFNNFFDQDGYKKFWVLKKLFSFLLFKRCNHG